MRKTCLIVLAASALAQPAPARAQDSPAAQSWAVVPDSLPGFVVVDSTAFEQDELGWNWRYTSTSNPELWLDLYLYPVPLGALCGRECSEVAATQDSEGFIASIEELVAQGKYDSVRVVKRGGVSPAKDSWLRKGRRLDLEVFREGEWRKSWYFVFAGRGTFLKVRATALTPDEHGSKTEEDERKTIERFVRYVTGGGVAPPYACPDGDADDGFFSASANFQVGAVPSPARIERAFAAEGFGLAHASEAEQRWVSTPRFEGFKGDSTAAEPAPVTVAGVAVFAGRPPVLGSTNFLVGARALCKGVSDSESSVVEMIATLSIMAALTGRNGR